MPMRMTLILALSLLLVLVQGNYQCLERNAGGSGIRISW